jgi:alpha-glucosidase
LIENLNEGSSPHDFKNQIDQWLNQMPDGAVANWVLGNHDKPRFGSRYGKERIDSMLTLLMTLPGISVTYNGDEIGMLDHRDISWEDTKDPQGCNSGEENFKWASRDPQRTPFQWDTSKNAGFSTADKTWLPMHPNYANNNLKLQQEALKSHYKFYQQLAELRQSDIFVYGEFRSRVLSDKVLGYYRELDSKDIYGVLINFSNETVTVNVNDLFGKFHHYVRIVLATSTSPYEIGDSFVGNSFRLSPFDAVVIENYGPGPEPTTEPTTEQPSTVTDRPTTTLSSTTVTKDPNDAASSVVISMWLLIIASVTNYIVFN